jgi:L-threonylcarbamoyladenylate synthase
MMRTVVLKVDPQNPDAETMKRAGEAIRAGGLVAFPTETVYGLAADAFNPAAVARVFEVKGRSPGNPLPVQVSSEEDIRKIAASVPEVARRLMAAFFPGPLTLVMPANPGLPEIVTAGSGKVGIRMPNHPIALSLIKAAGTPIVAPSANISGEPPPITADEVLAYLEGRIELVLDAGPTMLKVASTVIDVTVVPPVILRLGSIGEKAIRCHLQDV